MENKSFTASIEVSKSPQIVFRSITNDVAKWWGGKDLEGKTLPKRSVIQCVNNHEAHRCLQLADN
jgi:hypothetical protein